MKREPKINIINNHRRSASETGNLFISNHDQSASIEVNHKNQCR